MIEPIVKFHRPVRVLICGALASLGVALVIGVADAAPRVLPVPAAELNEIGRAHV